jgi:hypothetical protein
MEEESEGSLGGERSLNYAIQLLARPWRNSQIQERGALEPRTLNGKELSLHETGHGKRGSRIIYRRNLFCYVAASLSIGSIDTQDARELKGASHFQGPELAGLLAITSQKLRFSKHLPGDNRVGGAGPLKHPGGVRVHVRCISWGVCCMCSELFVSSWVDKEGL